MKVLGIIFSVTLVILILYGVLWMFHGFPVNPSNIKNAKPTRNIESNLNTFLTDTALPQIIESCIPLYNADFRKRNPQEKKLPDLITTYDFSKNQLIKTNHRTKKHEANLSNITLYTTKIDNSLK